MGLFQSASIGHVQVCFIRLAHVEAHKSDSPKKKRADFVNMLKRGESETLTLKQSQKGSIKVTNGQDQLCIVVVGYLWFWATNLFTGSMVA